MLHFSYQYCIDFTTDDKEAIFLVLCMHSEECSEVNGAED